MMNHICKLSEKPTFEQKGLKGYQFTLSNKNLEVYFVDITQGHDTYIISKNSTHMYYILDGKGYFDIDGVKHEVEQGMFIEVPPNIEYTYVGKMKLLLIMNPPWSEGNEIIVKENPNVK